MVAALWICDRSYSASGPDRLQFDDVVSSLAELRAGRLGLIRLDQAQTSESDDVLLGTSLRWETRTVYRPVHHPQRREQPAEAVKSDLLSECLRRGLPRPEIEIQEISVGPNGGNVFAKARLCFAVAVSGPLLLGAGSHAGSGLFAAVAG